MTFDTSPDLSPDLGSPSERGKPHSPPSPQGGPARNGNGFKFEWQRAFMRSKLPPAARHILHVLCTFMDKDGKNCFPSVQLLMDCTGYAKQTVVTNLALAVEAGWLKRWERRATGDPLEGKAAQGWRHYNYQPIIARVVYSLDHLNPEGGLIDGVKVVKPLDHLNPEGGLIDGVKVVYSLDPTKPSTNQEKSTRQKKQTNARARVCGGGGDGKDYQTIACRMVDEWNAVYPEKPVMLVTPARIQEVRILLETAGEILGAEGKRWPEFLDFTQDQRFLHRNGADWFYFDWLIVPENFAKVAEERYATVKGEPDPPPARPRQCCDCQHIGDSPTAGGPGKVTYFPCAVRREGTELYRPACASFQPRR